MWWPWHHLHRIQRPCQTLGEFCGPARKPIQSPSLRLRHESNPCLVGSLPRHSGGGLGLRENCETSLPAVGREGTCRQSRASELQRAAAPGKQRPPGQRARHRGALVGAGARGDCTPRAEQAASVSRSCGGAPALRAGVGRSPWAPGSPRGAWCVSRAETTVRLMETGSGFSQPPQHQEEPRP